MKTVQNSSVPEALQRLVTKFGNDRSLLEPSQLRRRLEALECLDAHFAFASSAAFPTDPVESELYRRAMAICSKLEAANGEIYAAIRANIQTGCGAEALLHWAPSPDPLAPNSETVRIPANGLAYDYLDDLLGGVLQLEEPAAALASPNLEVASYQPTPARHIFHLLRVTELSAADVFVDLGSGLGHVPLLASICTRAPCIGIERELVYIERARQCARRLNLDNATFLHQDAREADLFSGTIFYLYTPFVGSMRAAVLERLHREASTRRIRICSYGPITPFIAQEPWLEAATAPVVDGIAIFRSRD